jgi:shikimate kinase
MRGSGKTAIGRTLAEFLQFKFVDLDQEIENFEKMKIPEIVEKEGWDYFRDLESNQAKKIGEQKNLVISTGGGIILKKENIENLKKNGIVILIESPLEALAKRVAKNSNRPSLTGLSPVQELEKVWQDREKLYRDSADLEVFFDFETKNKKTDLIRKSKMIWKAVKDFQKQK